MRLLYFFIDFAAIVVPIIFSFHPKIGLYKKWSMLWPAILLAAIPFVIWDSYFTKIGIWGFTPKYLTGIALLGLPIEEILFFVCIPYACLFTYYCFRIYFGTSYRIRAENLITWVFVGLTAFMAILFFGRAYTTSTAIGLIAFLLFLKCIAKVQWMSLFYFSHLFLLIPFIIVNGILTGTGLSEPIVWYSDSEIIGFRVLTIPFEDIFYGMLMLLFNTYLFEYFLRKSESRKVVS
jgi:lycopene cyclase domain-containing protein